VALPAVLYDFKVDLRQVDRSLEQALQFKVARHPSETLERVWLRVLAFCWCWDERLAFGPGLSEPDAPDLSSTDYTGEVTQWIRVGKCEPERVQKVLDRNSRAKVTLFFDAPARLADFVQAASEAGLQRADRLELAAVDPALLRALSAGESRRAKLSLTVVGDHFYVDQDGESLDGPLERARIG
jgi:uncharacterized protein YaeQ